MVELQAAVTAGSRSVHPPQDRGGIEQDFSVAMLVSYTASARMAPCWPCRCCACWTRATATCLCRSRWCPRQDWPLQVSFLEKHHGPSGGARPRRSASLDRRSRLTARKPRGCAGCAPACISATDRAGPICWRREWRSWASASTPATRSSACSGRQVHPRWTSVPMSRCGSTPATRWGIDLYCKTDMWACGLAADGVVIYHRLMRNLWYHGGPYQLWPSCRTLQ